VSKKRSSSPPCLAAEFEDYVLGRKAVDVVKCDTDRMDLLERLSALLGPDGLLDADDDLTRYISEPRGRFHGKPLAVARPNSTEKVAGVVLLCREYGVAMVPQGGHTGLVGGGSAEQGELIISLERMRAVRLIDVADGSLVVEAGCTLAAVREAAAEAGLLYPVSLASEGTATIGGTLATNAGGNLTIRYGNTREQVLGLEVVLADGQVLDNLSPLRKDNSGYDLKQLFVGSEGTLGISTAAALRLEPAPRQAVTAMVATESVDHGLELLARLRTHLGETLSACEFLPRLALDLVLQYLPDSRDPLDQQHAWYVLVQADSGVAGEWLDVAVLDCLSDAQEDGLIADAVVADSQARVCELWQLREAISPAQKIGGVSLKHDISVPVGRIPDFIAQALPALEQAVPGVRPCIFGHLGDGNLHFNLTQPETMSAAEFCDLEPTCNRIVFDLVRKFQGSIAAEHGVGLLRRDELADGQRLKVEMMTRIKRALDPDNLLNPGKVI